MTPPRVAARGMAVGGRFRGASGTPPPTGCREWAAAGGCPSSGPAGPPSPKGEGKGCCWRQRKPSRGVGDAAPLRFARGRAAAGACPSSGPAGPPSPEGEGKGCRGGIHPSRGRAVTEGRGGVGAPRPTDGDMETLWGLRGHPFPGRRAVGAGHARPGGLRRQASMVRSVGRGLDPSAGVGGSGSLRGW